MTFGHSLSLPTTKMNLCGTYAFVGSSNRTQRPGRGFPPVSPGRYGEGQHRLSCCCGAIVANYCPTNFFSARSCCLSHEGDILGVYPSSTDLKDVNEMTPAAGLDIDVSVIELLDFAPVIPCEGTNHPRGLSGHDPEAPGAYMVISPCCGPKVIQCAARVSWMKATGDLYCGSCGVNHDTAEYTFVPLDTL